MYINEKKKIKSFIQYLKKDILIIQQRIKDIQSGRDINEYPICIYKEYKKLSYIKKQIKNRRKKTLKRLNAQKNDLVRKHFLENG